MLYVRYSAFFPITGLARIEMELGLSLLTLELKIATYVETTVIFYTLAAHKQSYIDLCSKFSFASKVIALDEEHASEFVKWHEFAKSIKNKTVTDQYCIVRMLADFHILPTNEHRLLIGCDILFLDVPQEVLRFIWGKKKDAHVLYMMDVNSFAGVPYRLRYYYPPILDGLLGDFYCLAPGVHLEESAIVGCLKMIDAWPAGQRRWEPEIEVDVTHACEQQTAAILLESFGGEALPRERYSHESRLPGLAVLHSHHYEYALKHLDDDALGRARDMFNSWLR